MNQRPESIVWVLGAGFSRSLGAPLLADFFSRESCESLTSFYWGRTEGGWRGWTELVARLYERGVYGIDLSPYEDTSGPRDRMWSNAEDFLDQLDTAASADESSAQLARFRAFVERRKPKGVGASTKELRELRGYARQFLAAECAFFTEGTDRSTERWSPYFEWARSIAPQDTVVSFNYDLVLELLARDLKSQTPLKILLPEDQREEGIAAVYKLHGSIDWLQQAGCIQQRDSSIPLALQNSPEDLCLATPGPSKALASAATIAC